LSLEISICRESRCSPIGRRRRRSTAVAECGGLAGVEERGTFIVGFSRNLGGPVASVEETGNGNPEQNPRSAECGALRLRERSARRSGGTAQRRKRSGAGRVAGSRSASPYRGRGGTNPREPVEGREHRSTGTFEGKMAETSSSTTGWEPRGAISEATRPGSTDSDPSVSRGQRPPVD
jgi:hypothetical protein